MAGRNQVTLTFAGESKGLEREIRRAMKASDDVRSTVARNNKAMAKDADNTDIGERLARKMLGGIKDVLTVGTKPIAFTAATAFSTQFLGALASSLASGAAKLVHGLASAVALLPAAAVAAGAALITLKVALLGVGDALKAGLSGDTEAFEEALKGLAPPAQAFAREIVGLKGPLDALKNTIQGNFFAPLVGEVKPLAGTYLPMLRSTLGDIASGFGLAGHSTAEFLRLPAASLAITAAMQDVRDAVINVTGAVPNLVTAFLPLIQVGASFLPRITAGFKNATGQLAFFMTAAAGTGRLKTFIQGGLDSLMSLWETGKRVVDIVRQLGDIGGRVFGGLTMSSGGLLGSVAGLVDRFQAFLNTAQGADLLRALFDTLNAIMGNLFGTFQRVAGIVGRVFAPVLPQILDFVEAFMNLKSAILDSGLDTLEPALSGLATGLGKVLPGVSGLMNFLSKNRAALAGVAAVITTLMIPAMVAWIQKQGLALVAQAKQIVANAQQVASWAVTGAAAVASAATTAASWVTSGALTVASFLETAAVAAASAAQTAAAWVAGAASAVASAATVVAGWVAAGAAAVVNAALTVAAWIAMAAQAAISAAAMAIAWIIAMGPIILAVAAVIAIVALLITHWDLVKEVAVAALNVIWQAVQSVFHWLQDNWPLLLAILTGPFGLAVLAIVKNWDTIKSIVGAVLGFIADRAIWVKDMIVGQFNALLGFFTGIPGRVASLASNMWTSLKDSFRNVLNGIIQLWNSLSFTLPHITIPSVDVPGLGKIGGGSWGGQSFSTPNIPLLHTGGTYRAPSGHREGLAMLLDGERVTRPGGLTGEGGNHYHFHIAGSVITERDLHRSVEDAIASGRIRVA